MTWSILVRDPATGARGAAVASRFFAVGGLFMHVEGGVAALATQALVNPMYAVNAMPRRRGSPASSAPSAPHQPGALRRLPPLPAQPRQPLGRKQTRHDRGRNRPRRPPNYLILYLVNGPHYAENTTQFPFVPGAFATPPATAVANRRALYVKVRNIQRRDLPLIYLFSTRNIVGTQKSVQGQSLVPVGLPRLGGTKFRN